MPTRNDLMSKDGRMPARGMFLAHKERGKVYGEIVRVRSNGTVVWRGMHGSEVATEAYNIWEGGYTYLTPEEVGDV
jgi:hypothetical protein